MKIEVSTRWGTDHDERSLEQGRDRDGDRLRDGRPKPAVRSWPSPACAGVRASSRPPSVAPNWRSTRCPVVSG